MRAHQQRKAILSITVTTSRGKLLYAILRVGKGRLLRDGMGIKEFSPAGDVGQSPFPGRTHLQILGDTGFRLTRGLRDNDLADNALAQSEDTGEIGMEIHAVAEVAQLLIHIKSLGGHIDLDMVMALELEEIADLRLEILIITVVPNHAYFIQKEEGVGFSHKVAKVLDIKMADAGHEKLFHVGIDNPVLFEVLLRQLDKVGTLAGALLAKNKVQFIRV